jgi:hypothetical protein
MKGFIDMGVLKTTQKMRMLKQKSGSRRNRNKKSTGISLNFLNFNLNLSTGESNAIHLILPIILAIIYLFFKGL